MKPSIYMDWCRFSDRLQIGLLLERPRLLNEPGSCGFCQVEGDRITPTSGRKPVPLFSFIRLRKDSGNGQMGILFRNRIMEE